jgi:hypothetical protein
MKALFITIFAIAVTFSQLLAQDNVGINNPNPDASAVLDIVSTDKGILIPRMTEIERTSISSPATGLLVYDNDHNLFFYFDGGGWTAIDPGTDNDWAQNGNHVYNASDSIGIGSSSPRTTLEVNGTVLFDGIFGSTPVSGAGTRLMWIPEKKSFRTGQVTGTQWDATNIGDYSFSHGFNSTASGNYSLSIGRDATASNFYSYALGYNATASGLNGIAISTDAVASGDNSIGIGKDAVGSGTFSVAIGKDATASGNNSLSLLSGTASATGAMAFNGTATKDFAIAMNAVSNGENALAINGNATADNAITIGFSATSTAEKAMALGYKSDATATSAFAIGDSSDASGTASGAIGHGAGSTGNNAYAFGTNVSATATGSMILGHGIGPAENDIANSFMLTLTENLDDTPTIFAVDDSVGINTTSPDANLDVNGSLKTDDFIMSTGAGNSYVMHCDASGKAYWIKPSNGALWSTQGNTSTTPGTDFIGTTDQQDLVFKIFNQQTMRLNYGGAFWVDGSVDGYTPTSGSGRRMMWIPNKIAFRAGSVSSTQWDDTNIGVHSVAFGANTLASGSWSFAAGEGGSATGAKSIAFSGSATGQSSIALGESSDATSFNAVSIGANTEASAIHAVAVGHNATASGTGSFAFGRDVEASGASSFILGTKGIGTPAQINNTDNSLFVGFNSNLPAAFFTSHTGTGIGTNTVTNPLVVSGVATSAGGHSSGDVMARFVAADPTNGSGISIDGASSSLFFAEDGDAMWEIESYNGINKNLAFKFHNTSGQDITRVLLEGDGELTVTTPDDNYGLQHSNGTITMGTYLGGVQNDAYFGTKSVHDLHFFTGNGPAWMTLDVLGNFGIGSTSPTARLDTRQRQSSEDILDVYNTSGTTVFTVNHNGFAGIYEANPVAPLHVNGNTYLNGNLGVGTSSPTEKLTVQTNTNSYGITHTDGTINVSTWAGLGAGWLGTKSSHPLSLYAGSSGAAVTVNTNGNVGIGNGTPGAKLDVAGMARVTNLAWPTSGEGMEMAWDATNNVGYIQPYDRTNSTWGKLYLGSGNVGVGTTNPSHLFHVNGVARSTQSTWATSSDRRVKKNINNLENAMDLIAQFRPVTYEWKETYKNENQALKDFNYGFISQEVEEVIPSMVTKVSETFGDETIEDFRVLNTDALLPLLVKALQEQQERIDQLEKKLEERTTIIASKQPVD